MRRSACSPYYWRKIPFVARRGAFTLLEMILSLAIGLVILGALYWVLSSQVLLTQKGRDLLDEGTVARSVLTRITSDVQLTLDGMGKKDERVPTLVGRTGGRTVFKSAGATRRRGAEATWDGRYRYGLSSHVALTWLRAEFDESYTSGSSVVVYAGYVWAMRGVALEVPR